MRRFGRRRSLGDIMEGVEGTSEVDEIVGMRVVLESSP